MRVSLSWLREYVDVPADQTGRDVAERLIRAGLEVESVELLGAGVLGPIVAGRVLEIEEFTASNGKTIRYCQVDVGTHNGADPEHPGAPAPSSRGIICGAHNFAVGDTVVVALPGAVLPGDFAISARKTYGHVSDGMICSVRELELGDDHSGILVLPDAPEPGTDLLAAVGIRDDVLDIAVTPDRGYAMSMRGVARETATAYRLALRDPASRDVATRDPAGTDLPSSDPVSRDAQGAAGSGHPVELVSDRCDRFVARTVTGLDPAAASPLWLQTRLHRAGMRPVSLAVDVTNYVMLEIGQPLHAYDAQRLRGPIVVRDAEPGESLRTLDDAQRTLVEGDLVIADDSGPIGLAGVMGGASTEITASTTDIVLEAAHFAPAAVGFTSRRLLLGSEAARRFERGVDPRVPAAAADRAVELLVSLGGAADAGGVTDVDNVPPMAAIRIAADHPDRVAGVPYGVDVVTARLEDVGCVVQAPSDTTAHLVVTPPSWRPDLQAPNDLAEEVIRLEGYDTLPSVLPAAAPGRGLTARQRQRRRIGRAVASAGYVEVLSYPFVGPVAMDALGLADDDERNRLVRLFNPLSDEEPWLRTTLLPGLLATARRNLGRGSTDLALFETGPVFLAVPAADAPPLLRVDRAPSADEVASLEALLPLQPEHLAVVLTGSPWADGPWGPCRRASWADAIEAVRTAARAAGTAIAVRAGGQAPWHPGRCAEILVDGVVVGWAGELHPRTVAALDLPPRTCAAEIDLGAIAAAGVPVVQAAPFSSYPAALRDLALVVATDVPAGDVLDAVRAGAGPLLEDVRLFDVYAGDQVGPGRKSLALRLRLRAADRTLTAAEVAELVDGVVAEAASRAGATLRA